MYKRPHTHDSNIDPVNTQYDSKSGGYVKNGPLKSGALCESVVTSKTTFTATQAPADDRRFSGYYSLADHRKFTVVRALL